MRISITIGRVAGTAGVVGAAAVIVALFGPGMPDAHADVWAPLVEAAGFITPIAAGDRMVTGTALVNGQTFHYRSGHSRQDVDAFLDASAARFRIAAAGSRPLLQPASLIRAQGAGVVSGFRLPPPYTAPALDARFRRFLQTTRLSDLGEFHMVAAFVADGTSFIEFVANADVRLDRLLPVDGGDAPGEDLPGVRRPDGLQRFLTVEHGSGAASSRTVLYRARDGRSRAAAFVGAMRAAGWTPDPLLNTAAVAHVTDGGRECFVGDGRGGTDALVVLVCRNQQ
jgi:hypothetical protein